LPRTRSASGSAIDPRERTVDSAYYGRFYPSALYPLLARINAYLVRWIRNKYRWYDRTRAARRKLRDLATAYPRGFRHSQRVTTAW